MAKLLEGVKVLDLSRVLAGPYCAMMLADMGADVIKVEMPGRGDDSRKNPPIVNGYSAYYMNLNRNKRGITLNLKSEKGKEIFRELIKDTDILVENYRPGVMDKLGLGYEELRKINPRLVYGAVSGFGQYGPYSKRPGYDIIGQAMSGLMSTTGWPDSPPTRCGTAISDVMGGISCCVGILAAYCNRLKTGVGEMVDVSLVDSMVSGLEIINMIYLLEGRLPKRIGNRYEAIYPYDSFKTSDGYAIIACGNNKLFGELKSVLQIPELDDPLYDDNINRVAHHDTLKRLVEGWTMQHTTQEVVDSMMAVQIPASPIYTIAQVAEDPHIAGAREMFVTCHHPVLGDIKLTGNQIKFKNHKIDEFRPAPELGADTEDIFCQKLGMKPKDVAALRAEGVI